MAGEVVVDALPYIDQGYDDAGVRESALAMVEEECRRYRPTKNYLEHLPPLTTSTFETKLMSQEFERIQNRVPMETLSMKRYELPPPSGSRLSEVSAWEESIDNSKAQLEHQWVRSMNLELMLDYGIEAWKAYLEVFIALQAKAQAQLQELKKEIQDVNWQRKQAQTKAGERLRTLEASWVLLVSKNYEIEQQCVELDKKIQEVRRQISERESESSNSNDENGEVNGIDDAEMPCESEPATEEMQEESYPTNGIQYDIGNDNVEENYERNNNDDNDNDNDNENENENEEEMRSTNDES